jgi:protein-disulfide isomerase
MAKNWLGLCSRRVTAVVRQPCPHVIKGGWRDVFCRTPAIIGGICVALLVLGANPPSAHAAESELEALRRDVRELRMMLEAQQAILHELKRSLNRLEQTGVQATRRVPEPAREVTISVEGRPFKGRPDAPVTAVEFSDYQCPYCGRFFSDVLPAVERELIATGKLKLVYRDYPLPSHAHARGAAYAAGCAAQQGKFWAMHDWLFAHTTELDAAALKKAGVEVGLDGAAYEACLQAEGPKADVDRDVRDGVKAGLRGTPSFVVGRTMPDQTVTGEMVTGVQSLESLRAKVNALIDE